MVPKIFYVSVISIKLEKLTFEIFATKVIIKSSILNELVHKKQTTRSTETNQLHLHRHSSDTKLPISSKKIDKPDPQLYSSFKSGSRYVWVQATGINQQVH